MKTKEEFEKYLQETVDPSITFRENESNKASGTNDVVGIYWGDIFTETSIPNGVIYEERNDSYTDSFGYRHRGWKEAEARVKNFIDRYTNDAEFRELYID